MQFSDFDINIDWQRRMQCNSLLPNGKRCGRTAISGENVCRWHSIMEGCCAKAKSWHRYIAIFLVIFGLQFAISSLTSLVSFLTGISIPALVKGVILFLFADYFISLSVIYWGYRYPIFAIHYAIGLAGMGVSLLLLLVASTIALPYGIMFLSEYAGNMPYPLFLIVLGVWGGFCLFQFATVVMRIHFSKRFIFTVITIFSVILILNAFFSGNKFLSFLIVAFQAGYILDYKYGWTKKLRKW